MFSIPANLEGLDAALADKKAGASHARLCVPRIHVLGADGVAARSHSDRAGARANERLSLLAAFDSRGFSPAFFASLRRGFARAFGRAFAACEASATATDLRAQIRSASPSSMMSAGTWWYAKTASGRLGNGMKRGMPRAM